MNIYVALGLWAFGLTGVPALIWFILWRNSFRHPVQVFIQTGKDPSDVVKAEDMCKVVENDGVKMIKFRRMRGNAPVAEGKLWLKFAPKNLQIDVSKAWETHNIANKLLRGLCVYRSVDGQYHYMDITQEKDLRVLSSDNTAFIVRQLHNNHRITSTMRERLITLGIGGIVFIVLGVAFIMFLVYLSQNAANLCTVQADPGVVADTVTGLVGA